MKTALQKALVVVLLALPLGAASSVPSTKPEDVGVSSERLQRITQMIQRRIASRLNAYCRPSNPRHGMGTGTGAPTMMMAGR